MLLSAFLLLHHTQGKLEAWVDPHILHTHVGVAAVPDAIDAMLSHSFTPFLHHTQGKLEAWVDPHILHTHVGVAAVPEAIDAMLTGGHLGKVVTKIAV